MPDEEVRKMGRKRREGEQQKYLLKLLRRRAEAEIPGDRAGWPEVLAEAAPFTPGNADLAASHVGNEAGGS